MHEIFVKFATKIHFAYQRPGKYQ